MAKIEVKEDGIYESDIVQPRCNQVIGYRRPILPKSALVEAMRKWYGIEPLKTEEVEEDDHSP